MATSHDSMKGPTSIGSAASQPVHSQLEAAPVELRADFKAFDAQKQPEPSSAEELGELDVEIDDASSAFDGLSTTAQSESPWSYDDNISRGESTSTVQVNVSRSLGTISELRQDYTNALSEVRILKERLKGHRDVYNGIAEQTSHSLDCLSIDQLCTLDQLYQHDEDLYRSWDATLSYVLDKYQAELQTTLAACQNSHIGFSIWQSWLGITEPQNTWLTSARDQEAPKPAYTTPLDKPGNVHPDHGSVPDVFMHVRAMCRRSKTRLPSTLDAHLNIPATLPQRVYSSGGGPRILRETRLPSTLDGHEISAIPDVGATANFIALRYVRAHDIPINVSARRFVQTAVGSAVDILGTVTLPFSFRDEKRVHRLEFNVMRDALHDVIIGSPFLKLTKTYTRYKHRLQQMLREVRLPRLRFLGSHQHVRGRVGGTYVDAVPDTGADVPVMALSFAKEHGFVVHTNAEHRILLQFADGSTATAMGMVRNMDWSFGSSEVQHHIDIYVLEELQTDLILDNTFLYDTNAFVVHERDFWTTDRGMLGDGWMISIIKLVDRVLNGSRWANPATSPTNPGTSDDEAWRLEKSRRLNAYSLARKHAQSMTEDQREAFLRPHLAQGKQFLESHPGRSSFSQSSISPTTSSTSSQAGTLAPAVVPTTAKRSSFFRRLQVSK